MCWRILGRSQRHFENSRTEQSGHWLCATPSLLFPIPLVKSCSCPSEDSFELVNLWGSYAPHGPEPALLQRQCDSALWKGPTPPAVSLWADLVNRGTPDPQLIVELMQAVCQVVHCASAQRAALSSRLVGWWFRSLGSDVDASAAGQRERQQDINPCCSYSFYCFSMMSRICLNDNF